jgi:hypothetical protein
MSPVGVISDPEKLKAVGNYLLPKGKHELRNCMLWVSDQIRRS